MPNWNQLLDELKRSPSAQDVLRRRHLQEVHRVTGRNVIAYYSGWLQKGAVPGVEIDDNDKNGFMSVIHQMDRSLGLDLLLHTPGGETAATESLVDYLRAMFDDDIRSIVPQLALSGGTMIACAAQRILMGSTRVSARSTRSFEAYLPMDSSRNSQERSRRSERTTRLSPFGSRFSPSTTRHGSGSARKRWIGRRK